MTWENKSVPSTVKLKRNEMSVQSSPPCDDQDCASFYLKLQLAVK